MTKLPAAMSVSTYIQILCVKLPGKGQNRSRDEHFFFLNFRSRGFCLYCHGGEGRKMESRLSYSYAAGLKYM